VTPYGASKAAGEVLAAQYGAKHGLDIVRVRPFGHTGPRQAPQFVCSDFARQLVEIQNGLRQPVIRVGNLEVRRDMSDVRDIVEGYWFALEKGPPGEVYNVCSERIYSLREILDLLIQQMGLHVEVVTEDGRLRQQDLTVLVGNCHRFRSLAGWQPRIPLEKTLADLLAYWREQEVPEEARARG
jgi:GDP-4-dehydro-6-deoxy-D-mannose reductase